ncbi:recombinase [Nocardia tenerifensis]|uniref:recombinase n=1 Tax=Nocardia tenerifensis TaxID=228006 RepID=UPI0002E7FF8B|nr:recombinase [Nocardia tenerifensis]
MTGKEIEVYRPAAPALADAEIDRIRVVLAPLGITDLDSDGELAAAPLPSLSSEDVRLIGDATATAQARNTIRSYATDWRRFQRWCADNATQGHQALPAHPLTVALYISEAAALRDSKGRRRYAPPTLTRWVAAIGDRHRAAGFAHPGSARVVTEVLTGIRRACRENGERRPRRAEPVLVDDVRELVTQARLQAESPAQRVAAHRDCALLLMGFTGAFRASEMAERWLEDITPHRLDGLHVRLRISKGSQEDEVVVALPRGTGPATCPPCAWRRWLDLVAAHDAGGRVAVRQLLHRTVDDYTRHVCRGRWPELPQPQNPAFRAVDRHGNIASAALTAEAVGDMLRRRLLTVGYDEQTAAAFAGHSLRSGFVTQSYRLGASDYEIQRQTRHKSVAMLRVYAREHAPLVGNAATRLPW